MKKIREFLEDLNRKLIPGADSLPENEGRCYPLDIFFYYDETLTEESSMVLTIAKIPFYEENSNEDVFAHRIKGDSGNNSGIELLIRNLSHESQNIFQPFIILFWLTLAYRFDDDIEGLSSCLLDDTAQDLGIENRIRDDIYRLAYNTYYEAIYYSHDDEYPKIKESDMCSPVTKVIFRNLLA